MKRTPEQEQREREANQFAMCLLMPEELVRKELKRMGGIDLADPNATKDLARRFQVSETMMAMRIGQIYGKLII